MRQSTLNELTRFLVEMDADLVASNRRSIQRSRVTTLIIQIVLVIMIFLFILNARLLWNLAQGMDNSLQTVDEMVLGFGRITEDVSGVHHSVQAMGQDLYTLQVITDSMHGIQADVAAMQAYLQAVNASVLGVNSKLYGVENVMGGLDGQMRGITQNVQTMGHSVQQISRPAKLMNSFMPW